MARNTNKSVFIDSNWLPTQVKLQPARLWRIVYEIFKTLFLAVIQVIDFVSLNSASKSLLHTFLSIARQNEL